MNDRLLGLRWIEFRKAFPDDFTPERGGACPLCPVRGPLYATGPMGDVGIVIHELPVCADYSALEADEFLAKVDQCLRTLMN